MKRWAFGLTLAAAAAFSFPILALAAVPGETEAAFLEWLEMAIERGEWRLASLGPGAAIFTRVADKPTSSGPRLWVRLELQRPVFPSGTLSMTQLLEFDCPGRRTRTLEGVSYKLNNLAGAGSAQEHDGGWSTVSPEQALDRVVNVACETPLP
jgi:hypothetical protein